MELLRYLYGTSSGSETAWANRREGWRGDASNYPVKFPTFYRTRYSLLFSTRSHHFQKFWATLILSTPFCAIFLIRCNIIRPFTSTVHSKNRCALIKTRSSIEIIVSKNWIKHLPTLTVLHVNRCLTTEYSETTAHFNGNFDIDKNFYLE
jgi:hypothetical protein